MPSLKVAVRSPREALEGLTVLPAPSLGLRFLVYTMRAWTPAWTPKMSSVTGGLGRSPPAVTETPRPRLRGAPTSPLLPHLSELPSQGAGSPAGTWGRGDVSRVSCGVRWEMLFETRFRRTLKPRVSPGQSSLWSGSPRIGESLPHLPLDVRLLDCSGRDTSPEQSCPGWGRSVEQEEAREFSAAGRRCPSLRPKGPDEGFRPFL